MVRFVEDTDVETPPGGYGIQEYEKGGDALAVHVERIQVAGYSVLDGRIPAHELAHLRSRLASLLDRQTRALGETRLAAIGDAQTVRCPLVDDDAFVQLASHPDVLALCRRLLGDFIVLMQQNGVINPPEKPHTQAAYHRDLPYQHFVSSRPLGISALFCLDPFRKDTGATILLPGSHRTERFPSADAVAAMATTVEAEPGSFIVFDSMVFHRAGDNTSAHPRCAVNHVFTVPIIAQQISLPDALHGRHADDPGLRRLLGYDSTPSRSIEEWQQRRLNRQGSHVAAPSR